MKKNDANRCGDVLELIHTDICGPFPTPSWNGQQYFSTFIDDYSCYDYLYLIHEKSQSLDVFKNFKAKVENQLSKKMKAFRSDHGGKYYGRYDLSGEQRPGPFAKYLMECESLWGEVVKTAVYILNRVPSKAVTKTLYELWTSKKPSIRNLHVWGYPIEARPYKPNEKKLDFRTGSCYFVGYFERSREIEDIPEISPTQVMEPIQVHEEVTQEPQEPQEHEFDMGLEDDPISVSQVKQSSDSEKWIEAMKDEMKSMKDNGVWDLVELPKGVKPIGCKWIFKAKHDSKGNIVRIIMALMAHYDLELHQMDDKTVFLNGNIDETIYMVQLENFECNDSKQLDLGDASFVLGDTLVAKSDKFSLHQCPKNELEKKDMEMFPYASAVGSLISSHLEIMGYSDSDFAGCLDSRRSTSGYIFMLAGGAISWKSFKQTLIASSIMEVEFIACYEASNHGIWLRNFVTQLRIIDGIEKPLRINYDNKAAKLYSKNNRSSSKSKHIDIKFLVVKERVQSLQVSIEHISTNSMIADLLT
ncbi:Retrovirus-related Pol polyprotein from transposon TNT 1-94 [Vitis vinifera]|uniref:Retrovirus-related Pol polyprotein from transposon TNT 1-94 n=1 Tax=Vitis vinifera TaxID=29760 RepID=A0A438GFQ4_VITVI|nr:Retrovirus-related Pol polyprotein from transposon TNT 1-94 [Vitis vinifera]